MTKILIIGASGFVGSNLLSHFETLQVSVRVMSRKPQKINSDSSLTEIVKGDLDDPKSLLTSVKGIETIYYLSHAMGYAGADFENQEKVQAENLLSVIDPKVKIIYLSGILPSTELSKHLRSRKQVGDILRSAGNIVIEFRASIIIGEGSTSFEMVRSLVNRVPFILSAKWSQSFCQPISIVNVVQYLSLAESKKFLEATNFEIGDKDIFKYKDLLVEYAKFEGLRRPEIKIDDFPKELAAKLLAVVIPEYSEVGTKLIESIEHETIVTDGKAAKEFGIKPLPFDQVLGLVPQVKLEERNFDSFFRFLQNNHDLPDYLKGQVLMYTIEVKDSFDISSWIDNLNSIPLLKISKDQTKGFVLKIPFVGQIGIKLSPDNKKLLIAVEAKYFFQKAGFGLVNAVLSKIK